MVDWIPLLDGEPVPPRPRTLSPSEESQLQAQVRDWLIADVIEQVNARPWVNNPVFVPKKNGAIRVCIDCRPVNAVTKDLDWPLPRLQELRHYLLGTKWMSRIDLRNAFFRIGIPREFRKYTAFRSQGKTYQFTKMPFGVKTGPSVFQRFMDHLLSQLRHECHWYIDDILIQGTTLAQLRRRTQRVVQALRKGGVEINQDKSEYDKQTILYAGLEITALGVGPDRRKLEEALSLPTPTTKKEKQSALGLVSYLRDFIPLLAHFTAELYPGKGLALAAEEYDQQWKKLMQHIKEACTDVRHWKEQEDAALYTDASGHAAAALIIQDGRIVSVVSRKLKGAEIRYSATDREHLSLVLAAQRFRVFLHRPRGVTSVYNDHAALLNRSTNHMMPRQERWNEIIRQWIPNLHHVKGEENPADWFSRWGASIRGGKIQV